MIQILGLQTIHKHGHSTTGIHNCDSRGMLFLFADSARNCDRRSLLNQTIWREEHSLRSDESLGIIDLKL